MHQLASSIALPCSVFSSNLLLELYPIQMIKLRKLFFASQRHQQEFKSAIGSG